MDRFLSLLKNPEIKNDHGLALTACGIKEQNPKYARRGDFEEYDEYGESCIRKPETVYESALDDTTEDEVKLVARCLLRRRQRANNTSKETR